MNLHQDATRRDFLIRAAVTSAALCLPLGDMAWAVDEETKGEEVSPAEDLMREHGLLNRVLLVYEENIRRLESGAAFDSRPLVNAATIIRDFVEKYHEELEEHHLFPRFDKANQLTPLVSTLREQHAAGRKITSMVLDTAASTSFDRAKITGGLKSFITMYRPHEAREDTVLFPAFRKLISRSEYDALGDEFEKKEHQLFGHDGFEGMVERVSEIEKALGIYELSQFTPR